ncbi:MAG: hypothetical protein ACOCUL_04955 [Bacteroidota bacterium]
MKNEQSKYSLQMGTGPLNKKKYQLSYKHTGLDTSQSHAFINPWHIPLGFVPKKKKIPSAPEPGKPKICNHYF